MAVPYRSTPVFDQDTLPAALRRRHSTKAGVWGVLRMIEGRLKLTYLEPARTMLLEPGTPALLEPGQEHFVTPDGPMKMQIDFYDEAPGG